MLIGVIDPTHKEKKGDASGRYPKWLALDDALALSVGASPGWSPWTYETLAAIAANQQDRGDKLSTTALLGCMRGTIVERKENYIGSLEHMYPSMRGTAMHAYLESIARPGSCAEWRFYTDVDGTEISGSPDLISYETLWDYKQTENPPAYDYVYTDHKFQLNFNRYIFNNATKWDPPGESFNNSKGVVAAPPLDPYATVIRHLAIVYLGPKGPKVLETTKSIKIQRADREIKARVPDVWSDTEVLKELKPRIEAWNLAWNSYPTWPDGLEKCAGWEGPVGWHCSGPPLCYLPGCLAKRYPDSLTW